MTCRVQTNRAKLCTTLISSRYGDTAYSDAIIISDTIRIPVHRFVLGSLPYFDRMLTSNMKEAVTGELVMTKTIPSFLLTNIVHSFLNEHVRQDNCLSLLADIQPFVEMNRNDSFSQLYTSTVEYFVNGLDHIFNTSDFQNQTWESVKLLLALDKHTHEETVFEAEASDVY